jgi:hypothetical protein
MLQLGRHSAIACFSFCANAVNIGEHVFAFECMASTFTLFCQSHVLKGNGVAVQCSVVVIH